MSFSKYISRPLTLIFFLILLPPTSQASDNNSTTPNPLKLTGFIDTYYAEDLDTQQATRTQEFLTQPKYRDEPSLNLAYLSLNYESPQFYSRLSLQYGDSVDQNYTSEKNENIKYIQEAYFGLSLTDKLKLDTGIIFSHIGLESFISYLNPAYTRSFVSEFSPYYQSGVRASYEYSDSWSFQVLLLNGWQNVTTYDGGIGLGTQALWKSEQGYQVSYNTYFGTESEYTRVLNDFVITLPLLEDLKLYLVTDVGFQNNKSGDNNATWTGNLMVLEYKATEKLALVGRLEYYDDQDGTIVTVRDGLPFSTFAYSVGANYEIFKGLLLRTELRRFDATKKIYSDSSRGGSGENVLLTSGVGYYF